MAQTSKSFAADRDLTKSSLWNEVEEYFQNLHAPGFGEISRASDLVASPDRNYLAFTGSILNSVEADPETRICLVEIETKTVQIITSGPHHDQNAAFSPDGKHISFLSDRAKKGMLQQFLVPFENGKTGAVRALPAIPGPVEYHFWSPDSSRILVGVAGTGAEKQSASGSGKFKEDDAVLPTWIPEVDTGIQGDQWRSLWIYDLKSEQTFKISPTDLNVWDGNWCGAESLVAVVSDRPSEGAWYHARLVSINITSRQVETLLLPSSDRQFSRPVTSPSGRHTATICALCSDRSIVAGNIRVIDLRDKTVVELETDRVDVTEIHWVSNDWIFFSGLRGLETVYGKVNFNSKVVVELWSTSFTSGNHYPEAAVIGSEIFAVLLEGRDKCQEVTIVQNGCADLVLSLAHNGTEWTKRQIGATKGLSWKADDGLEIQGFLTLPAIGTAPYPLIVDVHGGPVWAWQNRWPGNDIWALFVARGYAVLSPNIRGSGGRGQDFAQQVYGDMGGADGQDILAGIDHLVEAGIVDTTKVGITGRSYGGTMAMWLITQTDRFAASVPIAGACDWRSQHTTTNIPEFDQIFLQSDPYEIGGHYQKRSALLFAGRHGTPVLQIAGKEDYCVPSSQGLQYHRALLEKGVPSVLTVYPNEAHGVREFPAYIDYCVRATAWFEEFMPPNR